MTEPQDAVPEEGLPVKTRLAPGTLPGPQDAVADSPWNFRRVNEYGHVHVDARPGTYVGDPDDPLPMRSHARFYLDADGPQVGTAIIYPDGRVEGVILDAMLGARLVRHVGFKALTVTHDKVIINNRELNP